MNVGSESKFHCFFYLSAVTAVVSVELDFDIFLPFSRHAKEKTLGSRKTMLDAFEHLEHWVVKI